MCLGGHHFLIIYYTVIHGDLDSFGIKDSMHPSPNAFVLKIAHILGCYFGRIIFLEYESGLWAIEHNHIWGSLTVSGLF